MECNLRVSKLFACEDAHTQIVYLFKRKYCSPQVTGFEKPEKILKLQLQQLMTTPQA